jgi:drug/metabolite transporter (DMT)-like permease
MPASYYWGILFAILAGILNMVGTLMQKKAVNRIVARNQGGSFTAQFLRDPLWMSGLLVALFSGTAFYLAAQNRIGPALVPGLMASALIPLAFSSARLLDEKLRPSEWLGIIVLVVGITLLGFSKMEISKQDVDLLDPRTQWRGSLFSVILLIAWGLTWLAAIRTRNLTRGLLMAFSSALPYCISNLWVLPMLMTIGLVFSGSANLTQVVIFVLSCFILVGTNIFGIRMTQEAYRFAPANKVQPIEKIPDQIVPILLYLFVFQRVMTAEAALIVPLGVLLILAGGFLLGNRRGELEASQPASEATRPM